MKPDLLTIARAIAAPSRLGLLQVLGEDGLSVSEVAALVGLSVSTASYHLARLAHAGLAVAVRRGRHRVYKWPATRCALAFVEAHPGNIAVPVGAVLTDCVPSGDAAVAPEGPRHTPTQ